MISGCLFITKVGSLSGNDNVIAVDSYALDEYVNSYEFLDDESDYSNDDTVAEEETSEDNLEINEREPAAGRNAFSYRISSRKGWRRHPISGRMKYHAGTDYAAPCGTPIPSRQGGVITQAGRMGGYGNAVVVNYGSCSALYGHMSSITVRRGQQVSVGSLIGKVGRTGYATGCHLHYEECTSKHRKLTEAQAAAARPYPTILPQWGRKVKPENGQQNNDDGMYWFYKNREEQIQR